MQKLSFWQKKSSGERISPGEVEEDVLKKWKKHEIKLEKENIEKKINTNVQEWNSMGKKGTKRMS